MSQIFILTGFLVASVLLTGAYRQLALRTHIMDVPVSRSAHTVPTPVGGGLVIVVLFLLGASHYALTGLISFKEGMALVGALVVGAVGLLDDIKEIRISFRIGLQLASAIWVVWWLGEVPPVDVLFWSVDSTWVLNLLAILALVWLLNLYNFMDGIDGLAGIELVFVNVMSLILVITSDGGSVELLSRLLAVLGIGFLVWNWAPAKIFMGDVGSGFIGFTLGIIAIISLQQGSMTVWTWLILLGVFITDATVTLVKRYLAGEPWYLGHATHAYQKAAKHFNSHSKVSILVTSINCLWLAPLAYWSVVHPKLGMVLACVAVVPLIFIALKLGAGSASVSLPEPLRRN